MVFRVIYNKNCKGKTENIQKPWHNEKTEMLPKMTKVFPSDNTLKNKVFVDQNEMP